jgi:hypothetical protein
VEFKLYLIVEFQRLKDEENDRLRLDWNLQRTLAKINYRIHTDAIKETLIPPSITKAQAGARLCQRGRPAECRPLRPNRQAMARCPSRKPRETSAITAPLEQLVVLTNLESLNSVLIRQGLPQSERLVTLNGIAISQMKTLLAANNAKRLK